MPLNEVITIAPDLQELAWKVASELNDQTPKPVPLEGGELFSYDITKECKDLASRLVKANVCTRKPPRPTSLTALKAKPIKNMLRRRGKKPRGDGSLLALKVVTGWVWIEDDQTVILWAMRTHEETLEDMDKTEDTTEDTFKGPKLETKSGKDARSGKDVPVRETALSTSSVNPIFGDVGYRTEPPIPILTITYTTSPLEASDLTEHGDTETN